jgi:hypothetical protein
MNQDDNQKCLQACEACSTECERCAEACLDAEDVDLETMVECIRLDRDCADACRLAAALISRNSRFARQFCSLCAEICEACAAECGRHDSEHCRRCATACAACATACRQMAA